MGEEGPAEILSRLSRSFFLFRGVQRDISLFGRGHDTTSGTRQIAERCSTMPNSRRMPKCTQGYKTWIPLGCSNREPRSDVGIATDRADMLR